MAAILAILLTNLQLVLILSGLLGGAFLANLILGVMKSNIIYDDFDWQILWQGFLKGAGLIIAILLITTVVSTLFPVCALYGIVIAEATAEQLSILTIALPLIGAITVYTTDAIKKGVELIKTKASDQIELKDKDQEEM